MFRDVLVNMWLVFVICAAWTALWLVLFINHVGCADSTRPAWITGSAMSLPLFVGLAAWGYREWRH